MSDHGSSAKAILYAFLANLGIALAKLAAADLHELGQHAGRVHPLLRRLRQPGAAVPRPQAGAEATGRQASARLRQDHLLLELHRRADAVLDGRPVLDPGRLAQAARAPSRINKAWVALLVLGVSIGARVRSRLLGCLREINKLRKGTHAASLGQDTRATPSWWWCWAKTWPRWSAWCSRSSSSRWPRSPAIRCSTPSGPSSSAWC